ncbi:hypothetical protein HETIRDRAFT_306016 [Heterobasidion irregulare TC 32-1]|uniref:WD40 repeat-like protein n=1 Tax=Heterobasidion irregulare (strain TC 32-1) TaxID=747525 RepID=W4KMX2_HETIT|nr:uncharacterized protein HETIRDRAFT_306016 [Heterobasidion irregulare TC 32-1]ETW86725.1 hypothetical protein HETIRDRAFT_306016 [Heterobasidion irregulare TC 32-1]
MASAPILISADEINCLIHAYLQDSGFQHSAYAIRNEGRLDHSPHFTKHIPRGELVDLLSKALLYMEVEAHHAGNTLTANCKTGFSLLNLHVCSLDASVTPSVNLSIPTPVPAPLENELMSAKGTVQKRRSPMPALEDTRSEKRQRRDVEDQSSFVDSTNLASNYLSAKKDDSRATPSEVAADVIMNDHSVKKRKPSRSPALIDDEVDSGAIQLLHAHKTEVFVCAWNPAQPELLASGSKDAIVHLWNMSEPIPDEVDTSPTGDNPLTLAYSTNGTQADLTSLDWNRDGTLLAIGSYDSVLRVCTSSGKLYFSNDKHQGPIFSTRFSPTGRWLLTASLDGTACIWDIKEKKLFSQSKRHGDCCLDVDWLDDETFASCGADKMIHLFGLGVDEPIKTFQGHESEINQIKFDPSGTLLASCSDDRSTRIWNVYPVLSRNRTLVTPEPLILEGHKGAVSGIGWCPKTVEGKRTLLATSSFDHTARLWDAVSGACLQVFTNHKRPIYTLTWSPDGRWLSTGGGDGWLHVYDPHERKKVWSWRSETQKRGIFEIDWQQSGDVDRIALALESKKVGIIDISKIPALQRTMR